MDLVAQVNNNFCERQIARHVFRAYDIRGIVNEELDGDAYYTIGRAVATHLQSTRKIFIARDGRLTSEYLANALIQGLLNSNVDVIDLGAVATPVMYFATHIGVTDCGLMVTGSHNPANYNGIKIVLFGKTLIQNDIDNLYNLIIKGDFPNGKGQLTQHNILPQYIQRILQDIKLQRQLKVVVDCGNGIAGITIPKVLTALGCHVIPLFCEVDGNFPNHHPDPTDAKNLIDLQREVIAQQADIGLAFDGDADRLGVVTNIADIIWPDRLMMYYAQHILTTLPGATIVFDVKCSRNLAKIIQAAGGISQMCPTGHSIVKSIMKQANAALAGEMSGHLFFKDRWYGFDDALYSACRLLELITQSPQTVAMQFNAIPDSINTPEIKIPITDAEKFIFIEKLYKIAQFANGEIITIDGIRVEFDDGWGLLRASNTTPYLIARFEATTVHSLERIKQLFREQMLKVDQNLIVNF